jgi:hypothetical protein
MRVAMTAEAGLCTKQLIQLPAFRPMRKARKRPLPGDLLRGLHEAGPGHAGQRAADADAAEVGQASDPSRSTSDAMYRSMADSHTSS